MKTYNAGNKPVNTTAGVVLKLRTKNEEKDIHKYFNELFAKSKYAKNMEEYQAKFNKKKKRKNIG